MKKLLVVLLMAAMVFSVMEPAESARRSIGRRMSPLQRSQVQQEVVKNLKVEQNENQDDITLSAEKAAFEVSPLDDKQRQEIIAMWGHSEDAARQLARYYIQEKLKAMETKEDRKDARNKMIAAAASVLNVDPAKLKEAVKSGMDTVAKAERQKARAAWKKLMNAEEAANFEKATRERKREILQEVAKRELGNILKTKFNEAEQNAFDALDTVVKNKIYAQMTKLNKDQLDNLKAMNKNELTALAKLPKDLRNAALDLNETDRRAAKDAALNAAKAAVGWDTLTDDQRAQLTQQWDTYKGKLAEAWEAHLARRRDAVIENQPLLDAGRKEQYKDWQQLVEDFNAFRDSPENNYGNGSSDYRPRNEEVKKNEYVNATAIGEDGRITDKDGRIIENITLTPIVDNDKTILRLDAKLGIAGQVEIAYMIGGNLYSTEYHLNGQKDFYQITAGSIIDKNKQVVGLRLLSTNLMNHPGEFKFDRSKVALNRPRFSFESFVPQITTNGNGGPNGDGNGQNGGDNGNGGNGSSGGGTTPGRITPTPGGGGTRGGSRPSFGPGLEDIADGPVALSEAPVEITEEAVPLAETVELADEMVPLASLPKTGESDTLLLLFLGLGASVMMTAGSAVILRKS